MPFLRVSALAVATFLTAALSSSASAQVSVGPLAQAAPPPAAATNERRAESAANKSANKAADPAANKAKAGESAAAAGPRAAGATPAWLDQLPDAPMRIQISGTLDEPVVVATIGDFAADLGDDAKIFLRREFVEHFVTNVLELGGPSHAEPMISFLSQSGENERECTFRVGDVSGRLSVLVTPRRVFVMCSFSDDGKDTRNLAWAGPRLSLAS